jgi:PAS domain S-box-containing protein
VKPLQPIEDQVLVLSSEVSLACDRSGAIRWADPRAARLLGARPDLPFVSLAAPGTEDKAQRLLVQACSGQTEFWELVLVADGRPVTMAWRGAPTAGGAVLVGSLVPAEYQRVQEQVAEAMSELARLQRETTRQQRQLTAAHAEIQQRLTAERDARAEADGERARLQQVLDRLPEAILIADADGRFAVGNAAAASVLGVQVTGRPMPVGDEVAFGAHRFDQSPLPARELPLQRSALRGEVVLGEQLVVRHAVDGRDIPLLLNSAPLYDTSGRPAGAVAVFQDITSIKELERQKDEFLATVSHDLKNPLAGIKGWLQLLRRRARRLPDEERERWQQDLGTVEATATRMAAIIDELLDLTHLQMGRPLELRRQPTDLVGLARRVAADQQQLAEAHTIRIESELPSLEGLWDQTRLERVVGNLVSNAVKYSPSSSEVTLGVAREETPDGTLAVLSVHDQGVGIPPEELPRVFERFYRASNVADRIAGTGIGLAGAKQLVEQHGGSIGVQSTSGEGSTFVVRLPLGMAEG